MPLKTIPGTSGNDTIYGTSGPDNMYSGAGNDTLYAYAGNDILDGGTGSDTMDGGDGHDLYYVDSVFDKASEYYNDDLGGVDWVFATASHALGNGIEHLALQGFGNTSGWGNENNNTILGNSANNGLYGGAGNDVLSGHAGNDVLSGSSGNDKLTGGLGADQLYGGSGNDSFDFNSTSESNGFASDRILSFEFGTSTTGDKIDVSTIDANAWSAGNQAFAWGGTSLKGMGYLWVESSWNGDTVIKGNTDFDADAEFQVAVADGATWASYWASFDFIL